VGLRMRTVYQDATPSWVSGVHQWLPERKVRVRVIVVDRCVICEYRPHVGIFAVAVGHRQGGWWRYRTVARPVWCPMKKVVVGMTSSPEGVAHLAPMESDVLSKHHAIVAHCAVIRYDDGSPRQPGSYQTSTMGPSWTIQVIDPDSCSFFRAVGQTHDEALALACLWLETGSAPWEPARWLHAKKKPGKK